jgi:hypothetical protein
MNLAFPLRFPHRNSSSSGEEGILYFNNWLAEGYSIRLEKGLMGTGQANEEEGNGQDGFHGWEGGDVLEDWD